MLPIRCSNISLQASNAGLELIKSVCHVVLLDSSTAEPVSRIKSNMLRLINIGDFSDHAVFRNPCLTFVLPETICTRCNSVRPLDLCRDHYEPTGNAWTCLECELEYKRTTIEMLLVDLVKRHSLAYVLQDLVTQNPPPSTHSIHVACLLVATYLTSPQVCIKCKMVKEDSVAMYCSCSGTFKTVQTREQFLQTMKTLDAIGEFYQLRLLQSTLAFVLHRNGLTTRSV